jgi:hypothetical protein
MVMGSPLPLDMLPHHFVQEEVKHGLPLTLLLGRLSPNGDRYLLVLDQRHGVLLFHLAL